MQEWSHPVASFWAGDDLSFIEQMVIMSYLERGCDFTLYVPWPIAGIPAGTTVKDASEIMATPEGLGKDADRKSMAVWSDLFRIALLLRQEVIWVDMDAYCIAPYAPQSGYLFGRNDSDGILSGVLALPKTSPALQWMGGFVSAAEVAPPWREEKWINQRRKKGLLKAFDLPWGDTGPHLLTHALEHHGAMQYASDHEVFYPLFRNSLRLLWHPDTTDDMIVRSKATLSVHIFGFTKRYLTSFHQGLPPENSWLARRAADHGIDPAAAPAWSTPLD